LIAPSTPALLNAASTRLNLSSVRMNNCCTACGCETLVGMTRVREGVAISSATNSNSRGRRPASTTEAPSCANPDHLPALYVFARIAHHGSFTRAAAELGTSASALSSLDESRLDPAGILRINLPRIAATLLVMPMLQAFHQAYPNIRVELALREDFVDLVAGGYDAGIRLGESVENDMIAVRVSAHERMAVVGAPSYFAQHGRPRTPADLSAHKCIRFRFTGSGGLYRWEFERDGREIEIDPAGPLIINDNDLMIEAAKRGIGLAFVFRSSVSEDLDAGRSVPERDAATTSRVWRA
jgi:DNA-binding transcriptional LysR family regulator